MKTTAKNMTKKTTPKKKASSKSKAAKASVKKAGKKAAKKPVGNLNLLRQSDIARVLIQWNGSGDDGYFEFSFEDKNGKALSSKKTEKLEKPLESMACEWLPRGCEIDTGSIGFFEIDVNAGKGVMELYYRNTYNDSGADGLIALKHLRDMGFKKVMLKGTAFLEECESEEFDYDENYEEISTTVKSVICRFSNLKVISATPTPKPKEKPTLTKTCDVMDGIFALHVSPQLGDSMNTKTPFTVEILPKKNRMVWSVQNRRITTDVEVDDDLKEILKFELN